MATPARTADARADQPCAHEPGRGSRALRDSAQSGSRCQHHIGGAQAGPGDERPAGRRRRQPQQLDADQRRFNHNERRTSGFTGVAPSSRMTAAGYAFAGPAFSWGENISWSGVLPGRDQSHHRHRRAAPWPVPVAGSSRQHPGCDVPRGRASASSWARSPTANSTPRWSRRISRLSGSKIFVTGVVYNDTVVNDNFFTVGEQTAGRAVSGTGGVHDTHRRRRRLRTRLHGIRRQDRQLQPGDRRHQRRRHGRANNIKLDVVNGHEVWTNTQPRRHQRPGHRSPRARHPVAVDLVGGGRGERLFGNAACQQAAPAAAAPTT